MPDSSFNPALRDFLIYLEIERNASPETIDAYKADLRIFVEYLAQIMNKPPNEIDFDTVKRSHLSRFLSYLKNERGNSPRTINRKIAAIRSLYRFLTQSEEWQVQKNPVSGMGPLRYERQLPTYLTLEEVQQLLASIRKRSKFPERDYAIFTIFLQCGCRFSELLYLQLEDVDLAGETLRIMGKGRKERIVPLTPHTVRALRDYLRMRDPAVQTDRLFLNNMRRPLRATGLRRIFAKAIERSPLRKKNLTPHKLRHTCLTLLRQAGVDIRTLQEIAGHSSISTTQIYTHVSQREVRREMDKHPLK